MSDHELKFSVGDRVVFSEGTLSRGGYLEPNGRGKKWKKRGVDLRKVFTVHSADISCTYPYSIIMYPTDDIDYFLEDELEFAKGQMKLPFKGI